MYFFWSKNVYFPQMNNKDIYLGMKKRRMLEINIDVMLAFLPVLCFTIYFYHFLWFLYDDIGW